MNGPFLLIRATLTFFTVGLSLAMKLLGPKKGKLAILAGMAVSTVIAIVLQLRG